MRRPRAYFFQRVGWDAGRRRPSIASNVLSGSFPEAPGQDLVQNGQILLKISSLGALRKLLNRISSKMDNFGLKCPLWKLSGSSWAGFRPKWTILA